MSGINLSVAVTTPITCKRGDTFLLRTLKFFSDRAHTIPRDLTGCTFKMEVVNRSETIILTFTGAEFTIGGTDDNELVIRKEAEDMLVESSPKGRPYSYDLEMTDTDDVVTTILKGSFTIEHDLTNA